MATGVWERVAASTGRGEPVVATAPTIVSASRRTDIPAFYPDWFATCLRAGFLKGLNPFSGRPEYLSFAKTRAVVFWSKNPRPLLPYLNELDERGIGYYFQFTLNDYEVEGLEPGLPPLRERVETFRAVSERVGSSRVLWRYDPLLLADGLDADRLVERVARVGEQVRPYTEKLVIAFADIERYAKVQRRLRAFGKGCRELSRNEMRGFAEQLVAVTGPWGLRVATCAEAIDLSDLGIDHNKCIDDEVLARLFSHDEALMQFLGPAASRPRLKDKGQRKACGCIVSKDIGTYDTCPHLCRYCYANSSDRAVAGGRARPDAAAASRA